jgi:hypothetical protein
VATIDPQTLMLEQIEKLKAERDVVGASFEAIAKQLGCEPDNEAMHLAIERLTNERDEAMKALEPFANAAEKADKRMAEHGVSENASTGLGIKFKHLFQARSVLSRLKEPT